MLGKIFRKTNKGEDTSRYTEDLVLDLSEPDREEDGFLLVGQSLYERNVIYARNFHESQNHLDSPPAYQKLCHSGRMGNNNQAVKQPETALQNCSDTADDDCKMLDLCADSRSDMTQYSTVVNGTPATAADTVKHAYEDIPFQLSPVLKGLVELSQINETGGCMSRNTTADLAKYNYEFSLEKSVLQGCS